MWFRVTIQVVSHAEGIRPIEAGFDSAAIAFAMLVIIAGIRAHINAGRRPRSPDEMRENIRRDSGEEK